MLTYISRRILQFFLIIFIANSLTFVLPRLIPGDPIEEALTAKAAAAGRANVDIQAWAATYNAKFGLDQSFWRQYLNYWANMLRLDFGYSLNDYPATGSRPQAPASGREATSPSPGDSPDKTFLEIYIGGGI